MMKGESMIIYVIFSMNEQQQQQSDIIHLHDRVCIYLSYFLLSDSCWENKLWSFLGGGVLISTDLVYYKYIFI